MTVYSETRDGTAEWKQGFGFPSVSMDGYALVFFCYKYVRDMNRWKCCCRLMIACRPNSRGRC